MRGNEVVSESRMGQEVEGELRDQAAKSHLITCLAVEPRENGVAKAVSIQDLASPLPRL